MSSPILVTGATGNVGAPLVEALRAKGAAVRPASRHPVDPEGVGFDFVEPGTWGPAFDGVQTMFLVRPPRLADIAEDMAPALVAARAGGVRHVVLLSVQGAGHVPVLPHAALERWLRRSGMDWTFLRPSYFDQNLSTVFAADIRERDQVVVPAGNGRTAFVDAHDVAAVAAAVLLDPAAHAGRIWTPTGAEALTWTEAAARLSTVLGRTISYRRPGVAAYLRHARTTLGMDRGMAVTTALIHATARLGVAGHLTDDVRIVTGRAPTSLAAFARRERGAWEPSAEGGHGRAGGTGPSSGR
ncbi:NmrA family NAD(P)-binding protein [Kocuria kalidii]|uniref:NmrA family NAD(P)-binding protein n=1 Tax=Kocuria kalidii TaxID=3376283 RepID=UPI003796E8FB